MVFVDKLKMLESGFCDLTGRAWTVEDGEMQKLQAKLFGVESICRKLSTASLVSCWKITGRVFNVTKVLTDCSSLCRAFWRFMLLTFCKTGLD